MKLEYIGIGISCIYACIGIYCICMLDWHLDHMCAFGIWFEMLLLGNFHGSLYSHEISVRDGVENYFMTVALLMKYYIFRGGVLLSWNTIFPVSYWNAHEIYFMTVALTKFISWQWLSRNTELSRNSFHDGSSHEIPQKTVMKTLMQTWRQRYFHEGGRHELPPWK